MKRRSGPWPTCTRVLSLTTLVALLMPVLLAGCTAGSVPGEELVDPSDGSLEGELAVYIADDFERGAQTRYAIRSASGQERWLDFDVDPGIEAGTRIKVWGSQLGERFRVSSLRQTAPRFDVVTSELRNGMKYKPKSLAFVIVNIGQTPNVSLDDAKKEVVGPSASATDPCLRDYYAEVSYGTEELDGDAFQVNYTMNGCDTTPMATALRPMIDQMAGRTFNHYLWYLGTRNSSCSWSGLGEVGSPDRPQNDTWYNASRSCVVMVQEPGHNFGMQHSSSMRCSGGVSFPDTPQGACTHSEYGDPYDPMGSACRHMNAWQKTYNGWLQGCNIVRVRSSGTFTLLPLELPCDGAQVLQIPMPKTRMFMRSGGGGQATNDTLTHYYLELRTKRGVDGPLTQSVQVRVSGDFRGRAQRGALHTWILDMNPTTTGSSSFEGLGVGGVFKDPAGGVEFTVTEMDANHATVQVTMEANGGGPVCLDGTTAFEAPGPDFTSCNADIARPGAGGASGGTGGAGGGPMMGTGGMTGAGGRPGVGGAGGRTGVGGRGGNAGMSGAGTGGGPAGGTGGRPGTGGTAVPIGTGGTPVVVGTGGNTTPGTGGNTTGGTGGRGGGPGIDDDITGGCACSLSGLESSADQASLAFVLALGGVVAIRRRRRRP